LKEAIVQPLRENDPSQIGPYKIAAQLGKGGMARVYLGLHDTRNELAAVKVMDADPGDSSRHSRFKREISLAKQVNGYYTAKIIDADASAPEPWYACEYIPGPTLREAVQAYGGGLPESTAKTLAIQLFEAIGEIRAQGVIHRDLTPKNMIIGPNGLRVYDFGIARHVDQTRITAAANLMGTPGYHSPQLYDGDEPGPADDIFAYGCVLTCAASGHTPFPGSSDAAIMNAIVNRSPDLSSLPESLRPLIEKCVSKDPLLRWNLDTIRPYLPGEPSGKVSGTAWLPPSVATQVTQATAQLTSLSVDIPTHAYTRLAPTRPYTLPIPTRAYTRPVPPSPKSFTPKAQHRPPAALSIAEQQIRERAFAKLKEPLPKPHGMPKETKRERSKFLVGFAMCLVGIVTLVMFLPSIKARISGPKPPALPVPTFTVATTLGKAYVKDDPLKALTVTKVTQDNYYLSVTTEESNSHMIIMGGSSGDWCIWVQGKEWMGRLPVAGATHDFASNTVI
jgi:serine/threonine protein kinase